MFIVTIVGVIPAEWELIGTKFNKLDTKDSQENTLEVDRTTGGC